MGFYAGIDGGGTGSRFVCADENGKEIYSGIGPALNGNGLSKDSFIQNIMGIVNSITKKVGSPDDCKGLAIGLAGISNVQIREGFAAVMNEAGFRNYSIYGDHETAFSAAFPEQHGILLISGTGSLCFGKRPDGMSARAGGYGHLIDDKGSAYDISIRILEAVVRAEDGRGENTVFRELVFDKLGIKDVRELIGYVYSTDTSKGDIAALAPLLSEGIKRGDSVAVAIEDAVVEELNSWIFAVKKRLDYGPEVALWGSVLQKNDHIREKLEKRAGIIMFFPQEDASVGALRLAMKEV